jgi:hypothetical protein
LLQVERALEGVGADSPFADVAEACLVELRSGGTPEAALTSIEHMLRQVVLPTFRQIPIDAITAESIELFLARVSTVSADRGTFASGVLDMVMDFGARNGVVSANPMLAVSRRR